jgi:hypothetical protein
MTREEAALLHYEIARQTSHMMMNEYLIATIGTHPILLPGNVIPRETHCYERKSSFLIVRRICGFAGAPCTSRKAS